MRKYYSIFTALSRYALLLWDGKRERDSGGQTYNPPSSIPSFTALFLIPFTDDLDRISLYSQRLLQSDNFRDSVGSMAKSGDACYYERLITRVYTIFNARMFGEYQTWKDVSFGLFKDTIRPISSMSNRCISSLLLLNPRRHHLLILREIVYSIRGIDKSKSTSQVGGV